MKIAGKRSMEPEWSSQNGAARMEQGRPYRFRSPFCRDWVFDGTDAVTITSLIYIVG